MANASKLVGKAPVRALLAGYPGGGKTGALASLANAGFKIRMLDYDGNPEPLLLHTKPEFYKNLDIVSLEDKMRNGPRFIEPNGLPTAFAQGLKLMDEWKYTDPDGEEVNLGKSKEWENDTIVVLDSLTAMGQAAFRRVQNMLNKTPLNTTQQVWGVAMAEQEAFIEKLTSYGNRFHVIVLAHLTMVGPKDIMAADGDLTKDLKERAAQLVPTKLFPSALGQQLPPKISSHFPTVLKVERETKGHNVKRYLLSASGPEFDTKVPAPDFPAKLEIETGMLTVFKALSPQSVERVSLLPKPNGEAT